MSTSDFTVPTQDRYFEDYVPGSTYEYGPVSIDESEIIDFARRFDPQYFHVDPEAAARGPFGGLIASGWHTGSLMMRLLADHFISKVASLGSPGIDELRWLRPVRPRDSLRLRVSILEANRSRSKPHLGIVRTQVEVLNQNDEVVMTLKAVNMLLCRPA